MPLKTSEFINFQVTNNLLIGKMLEVAITQLAMEHIFKKC